MSLVQDAIDKAGTTATNNAISSKLQPYYAGLVEQGVTDPALLGGSTPESIRASSVSQPSTSQPSTSLINEAIRDPATGQLIPPTGVSYNPVDPSSAATVTAPTVIAHTASSQGYNATQAGSQGYDAVTGEAVAADATTREVTPEETMQHQLAGIIDSNSPLIQRARARAMEEMNARGLQNSSMALGAADAALYDVAMPIAQFDAAVYGQAARDNQNFLNQVAMFNAGQTNQMTATNIAMLNNALAFTADAANRAELFNADATNTASRFTADASNRAQMFNAEQVNTASRFTADAANTTSRFNAEQMNTVNLANAEAQLRAGTFNAASYNDLLKMNIDNAFKAEMFNADTETKIFLQTLEGDIAGWLADKEAEYKNDLQASISATAIFQQGSANITEIIKNPDMTPEAKKGAINFQLQLMDESLKITGAVSDLDLSSLFEWEMMDNNPDGKTSSTSTGSEPVKQTVPATTAPEYATSYEWWRQNVGQYLPSGGTYAEYQASGGSGTNSYSKDTTTATAPAPDKQAPAPVAPAPVAPAPAPVAPAPVRQAPAYTMSYDQWQQNVGQWLPSGGSYAEYQASGLAG
jgi:hypothetical protein